MMDIIPAAAALAVIMLTASLVMRMDTSGQHTPRARRRAERREQHSASVATGMSDEPSLDPWPTEPATGTPDIEVALDDAATPVPTPDILPGGVPAGANDPWVVHEEPLIVPSGDIAVSERRRGGGPVLAYIQQPRRSPDPDRFIQTEILIPTGTVARLWSGVRLLIAVVVFGTVFGLGPILLVRGAIALFSN